MTAIHFESHHPDTGSRARLGRLTTPHGTVDTPAFIVVGTQATVKSLRPEEVAALGAQAVLCNTYHLYLRPGADLVAELGGLHRFMGWSGPMFTDSGGYQVFSLGSGIEHGIGKLVGMFPEEDASGRRQPARSSPGKRLSKVDDDGVTFRSHIDGSTHRLTPESSIDIQEKLGADIILAFDEPTSPLHDQGYTTQAMHRTHRWAERCLAARRRTDQALYGIVQGGAFQRQREQSARFIGGLPFDGFAIGGSLGKSKRDMERVLDWSVPALPADRPRHMLGIGEPEDLFACVERGVDTFDCVAPTRLARRGVLLTGGGRLTIAQAKYRADPAPIEAGCGCPTCRSFSRAYLRHLFVADELLAYTLATMHNLFFTLNLMARVRGALADGTYAALKDEVLGGLRSARVPATDA
ncbi:MAG: tRNA guanosine(34) transglycosylase Tgt [Chloroflexota bacterium]|nr:tRNA guanosine(34) transglycosylase Tgt [Chloroflexota bacterium]